MGAAMTLDDFSWPLSSVGEGMEQLARRAGLSPTSREPVRVPEALSRTASQEFSRFVSWAGERLGIEAEAVNVTVASVEPLLLGGGPAVLQYVDESGPRLLFLAGSRYGKARLLCPDLQVRSCPLGTVRDALCAPHEAALLPEIASLLEIAQVSARRAERVRVLIARERLGEQRIAGGWILRLPPTSNFWQQLREVRLPGRLAAMLALFALTFVLELAGWSVIGAAALEGRLDFGWLTAWVMLIMSIVPLRLLAGWIDATLALDVSRLIKTRLLLGALNYDLETVRRQGAGQLLGRVMESQAFESLALNFGLGSLVALLELVVAAWVLSRGAAALPHLVLLGVWVAVAVALSSRYFARLGAWTRKRLEMTHALVERMVGHRTTLAQESPERRDFEQDQSMKDYLQASTRLDRAATPFLAGVPNGWMLLSLAVLAPVFVSGSATPAGLAISLGGILMASRALTSIATGLSAAAGAAVAWRQIGPLFTAGARPSSTAPFVSVSQMEGQATGGQGSTLIDADNLGFRYQSQGEAVLKQASLTIQHGDRVLIEGPSGGGKSTFASLLVGLRTPDSGLLLLNGLDRFTLGDSWHRFATEAPQFHENHVLSGTLGFNLLMGRNWPAGDDELQEATDLCEELGLGPLLRRMPSGLMQTVGETGWQLSHGERSRVFLARALLQDAQLTVLDESFAALDPESLEACLGSVMRRARTLAVIAHP